MEEKMNSNGRGNRKDRKSRSRLLPWRRFPGLLAAALFPFLLSCTNNEEGIEKVEGDRVFIPDSEHYKMYEGANPKYFTTANPGKWEGKQYEHLPRVQFYKKNQNKFLSVKVNLKQSRIHHIETILLLNHLHEEIQSVPFEIDYEGYPQTDFYLGSGEIDSRYFVVAKCNKHDMWEQIVILSDEEAGKE